MPTALVTGSNWGIGFEFVRQLAEQGWNVLATCRDPASADRLNAVAAKTVGKIEILPLDVASQASIKQLAATLNRRPIDLLVCNAGISGPKQSTVSGKEGERIQISTMTYGLKSSEQTCSGRFALPASWPTTWPPASGS